MKSNTTKLTNYQYVTKPQAHFSIELNFTLFNNAGVRSCDFSTAEQALEWSFLVIFAPKLGILYK